MRGDPDHIKSAAAIIQAEGMAARHIRLISRRRADFTPGANIEVIELSAGIWQVSFAGLVPCAFRIGEAVEDGWYLQGNFEQFDPAVHQPRNRLVNSGEELRWRPIGAGPYVGTVLHLVNLSRTNTYGG